MLLAAVTVAVAAALLLGVGGTAAAADGDSTEITSCTQLNVSGSYHLGGDIEPEEPGEWEIFDACIVINASSVTLDGMGHTIDGTSVSGVANTRGVLVRNETQVTATDDPDNWLDNVTVRNVDTRGWSNAVSLRGAEDVVVRDIDLQNTTGGADVSYESGANARVTGVTATDEASDVVVSVREVEAAVVADIDIERSDGTRQAISVRDAPGVEITNNTVDDRNNTEEAGEFDTPMGILVRNTTGAVVTNNTVLGVDGEGIRLSRTDLGTPNALVADNEIRKTGDAGVVLRGDADGSTVRDNHLDRTDGIRVVDSAAVAVRNNRLFTESNDGKIHIEGATGTAVVGNEIDASFRAIEIVDADPERLADNTVRAGARAVEIQGESGETYDGFSMTNNTVAGDVLVRSYQNLSISALTLENGTVRIERGFDDRPRNVTVSDAEITDNDAAASVSAAESDDVTIDNVTAVGGQDGALVLDDVSEATVRGVTVTGHDDSDEESSIRVIRLTGVDNASVSELEIVDNPMDGDDASSFIDGRVVAVDLRNTRDTTVDNVTILNNTHGADSAVTVRGDSANVSLESVRVSGTETGAIEVEASTTNVTASAFTVGAGTSTNATLSFEASGVVVDETSAPPNNPDAASIGRYFDARNTSTGAFLDVDLHYEGADATGVDEETLTLWRYDGGAWSELSASSVDTTDRSISANITTFSTFGAFAEGSADASIEDYADDENIVRTEGLRDAIDDWRAGDIDTGLLRDVIDAWRVGDPVG
jgi:hypothetical protein